MRWQVAQSFEWQWWKRYLRDKPVGPYLEWKKNYWSEVLQHITKDFELKAGDKVLDAGCGPAGIFTVLQDQKVDAFDPLMDRYRSELDHFNLSDYPWCDFRTQRMEELNDQESYDLVCCLNVINHVQNIEQSVTNLVAASKRKGWVALSIDAHNHGWAKPIYRAIPFDVLHPHQYDLEEYSAFLRINGIERISRILLKKGFWFDHYLLVGQRM